MSNNEKMIYDITMKVKVNKEDWAVGVIAGMEGFTPVIVNINLETRELTLLFKGLEIIDGR